MTLRTNVVGATDYALQEAIGGYSDEAYTNAKKLSGTGITSPNPLINKDTETFTGQLRWQKPLNPTINVASITDSTDGTTTSGSTEFLNYIKTVRTHGVSKVNIKDMITQVDGLAKVGRDFSETRAQDEHNALLAILKGVAIAELMNGAAAGSGATGLGGQTFTNDPVDKKYGFYVDLGSAAPVITATAAIQGASRAEGFLQAFGAAFKDYEPDWAYLVVSPEVYSSLRSANLVDEIVVTDGNVDFNTIFNGKFRLILSRANQSLSSAEFTKVNTGAGVDIVGQKTSFIVLPGAIAMEPLDVPLDVEIQHKAAAYKGGGTTEIWYRWGYVFAPAGYDWVGTTDAFPSDADYKSAVEGGTMKVLTDVASGSLASTTGVWKRKFTSALSLGILPIFHS